MNKTAPAILAIYFTGTLPDSNYREIILAMHKYASQQCVEKQAEIDRLKELIIRIDSAYWEDPEPNGYKIESILKESNLTTK